VKRSTLVALVLALAFMAGCWPPAHAGDLVVMPYIGANAISFDANSHLPSDFEAGGGGSASLSPHITGVGSVWYGFGRTYLRGSGGFRVTATDVNDPNFSIGLGIQYQASTKPALRPNEWAPDVSIGWRPWPTQAPKVTLGAQASFGLNSNTAALLLGVRYAVEGL
jgi:hypothetical protein